MPPEAFRILGAISIWLLLAIALPKRRLPGLRGRLVALAAGKRRWLYAAPMSWSRAASQRRRPLAEALRAVELGAPIWVIARVLEERSARRRLEDKALWADSSAALIYARAAGNIKDQDLQARLSALGSPLPAEKVMHSTAATRPALPLDWWADRHPKSNVDAPARTSAEPSELPATAADMVVQPQDPDLLVIRTFGRLQLLHGDQDLSDCLLQKPVLAFTWLYLLARALARPDDRISRAELAEELTPGLAPERQRKRLRDRLSDMLHGEIPRELAARVTQQSDEGVSLDLQHAISDFDRLLQIALECKGRDGLLSPDHAHDAIQVLGSSEGEFLAEWDRLEDQVTGGRGAAGEIVRQLRERAESARVELLAALAANHLARQEPERAVSLLEQALERRPDHEGVARRLVSAYLQAGQISRAAELQRSHQLSP